MKNMCKGIVLSSNKGISKGLFVMGIIATMIITVALVCFAPSLNLGGGKRVVARRRGADWCRGAWWRVGRRNCQRDRHRGCQVQRPPILFLLPWLLPYLAGGSAWHLGPSQEAVDEAMGTILSSRPICCRAVELAVR